MNIGRVPVTYTPTLSPSQKLPKMAGLSAMPRFKGALEADVFERSTVKETSKAPEKHAISTSPQSIFQQAKKALTPFFPVPNSERLNPVDTTFRGGGPDQQAVLTRFGENTLLLQPGKEPKTSLLNEQLRHQLNQNDASPTFAGVALGGLSAALAIPFGAIMNPALATQTFGQALQSLLPAILP